MRQRETETDNQRGRDRVGEKERDRHRDKRKRQSRIIREAERKRDNRDTETERGRQETGQSQRKRQSRKEAKRGRQSRKKAHQRPLREGWVGNQELRRIQPASSPAPRTPVSLCPLPSFPLPFLPAGAPLTAQSLSSSLRPYSTSRSPSRLRPRPLPSSHPHRLPPQHGRVFWRLCGRPEVRGDNGGVTGLIRARRWDARAPGRTMPAARL